MATATATHYVMLIWLAGVAAWTVWITTAVAYNKFDRVAQAVRHGLENWTKRREEALRQEL
jgi:hypothetical protein